MAGHSWGDCLPDQAVRREREHRGRGHRRARRHRQHADSRGHPARNILLEGQVPEQLWLGLVLEGVLLRSTLRLCLVSIVRTYAVGFGGGVKAPKDIFLSPNKATLLLCVGEKE